MREEFAKLIAPYVNQLLFPQGIYGGIAYYIVEDGFYGPQEIANHVVPMVFNRKALDRLNDNIMAQSDGGFNIIEDDPYNMEEDLVNKLTEGVELSFGDGWEIDSYTFLAMVKQGCEPDRYYLDKGFNSSTFDDFIDVFEDGIVDVHTITMWSELSAEDIREWCQMLSAMNGEDHAGY